ncbi:MAG: hypothetical protein J6C63_03095 [Lachnospiraceae bacterium]|nr:hypothetical protein [Lachnospiraceae bacterium]
MNENLQWMSDERITNIPKVKLDFLQKIFFESKNLTQKEQLPFFMALAGRAKKDNISFSQDEINLIMEVIKDHSSPEEVSKINQTIKLFKNRK